MISAGEWEDLLGTVSCEQHKQTSLCIFYASKAWIACFVVSYRHLIIRSNDNIRFTQRHNQGFLHCLFDETIQYNNLYEYHHISSIWKFAWLICSPGLRVKRFAVVVTLLKTDVLTSLPVVSVSAAAGGTVALLLHVSKKEKKQTL